MKNYTKAYVTLILLLSFINLNTATSQLRFGIHGGFDVISNRINKDILNTHNRLGFQVGGTIELMAPIVGWGGQLSVLYGHQEGDDELKTKQLGREYNLTNYDYVRLPLNLKKKFSIIGLVGVFIQVGPYIEFKLSGGDFEEKNISNQYKSKSFGAGLNAGAGIEILKHLELGMYYRKALTDNYGDDAPSIGDLWKKKPDNWSVDLTYFF